MTNTLNLRDQTMLHETSGVARSEMTEWETLLSAAKELKHSG
jgi:hypothetical protein